MKKLLFLLLFLPGLALAQLQLPYSIKVVNPKPLDWYYYKSTGVPYANTGEVTAQVPSAVRYKGQTFNVNGSEYWFAAGITNGDLAVKTGAFWPLGGAAVLTADVTMTGTNAFALQTTGTIDFTSGANTFPFFRAGWKNPSLTPNNTVQASSTTIAMGSYNIGIANEFTATNAELKMAVNDGAGISYNVILGFTGGLKYSVDVSSGYTARSLVDQGYVLGAKTFTGTQTFATAASGLMPVVLPHGAAPTGGALVNGGLWTTTAGLFARINGATVGPFGIGGGTPGGADTQFQYNNAGAFGGATGLTYNNGTAIATFSQIPIFTSGLGSATANTQAPGTNNFTLANTAFVTAAINVAAQPFSDATALIKDNGDATKLWRIEASSISTTTTRVWTVPDFDGTFARSSGTNTFTGVQTFNSLPTIPLVPSATTDATSKKYVDDLTLPIPLTPDNGGTGVVNNAASTLTISGAFGTTVTVSGTTAVTFPTAGTLATLAGSETLSSKTLTAPKFASGGFIADANGNEELIFTTTASAINEVTLANAASGGAPKFSTTGGGTDISLDFATKGAGSTSYSTNNFTITGYTSGISGSFTVRPGSGNSGIDIIAPPTTYNYILGGSDATSNRGSFAIAGRDATGTNYDGTNIHLLPGAKNGSGLNGNVGFFTAPSGSFPDTGFGSGGKVVLVGDASTNPPGNPTAGFLFYSDAGNSSHPTLKLASGSVADIMMIANSAAAPATTGTMTTTLTNLSMMTITPSGACTFNASGGLAGQRCVFVITTSGVSSFNLTWGTNYKSTGILATGTTTAKVFTVSFAYDGTNWNEVGRTTAM